MDKNTFKARYFLEKEFKIIDEELVCKIKIINKDDRISIGVVSGRINLTQTNEAVLDSKEIDSLNQLSLQLITNNMITNLFHFIMIKYGVSISDVEINEIASYFEKNPYE